MTSLKRFAKNKKNDFKVIVLFNSVSDSLFNNDPINFDNNVIASQKLNVVKNMKKSECDYI